MHGHFDITNLIEDAVVEDDDEEGKKTNINTGIGMVIPRIKILEALYQPEMIEVRQTIAQRRRKAELGATPDLDDS
jgi:hypothetical protein